jgi:hypothetical protein
MSPKQRSPLYQQEQEMIDAYHNDHPSVATGSSKAGSLEDSSML